MALDRPLTGHNDEVNAVNAVAAGMLSDGTQVIVSGGDTIRVWRLADGAPIVGPLTGHSAPILAVATGLLPDGTPVLVSGSHDGTVRVWRLSDGIPLVEPLTGHQGAVSALAVGKTPDGTPVIVSGGYDHTVRVWRLADGASMGEPLTRHGAIIAVAIGILRDGIPFIVSGSDDSVGVWNLLHGTPIRPQLRLPASVRSLAVRGEEVITATTTAIAVHQLG